MNFNTAINDQQKSEEVTIDQLVAELQKLNKPIEEKAKNLTREIVSLKGAMEEKILECDRLHTSGSLKELEEVYNKGIEVLQEFSSRQDEIISELKRRREMGGSSDSDLAGNWKELDVKVHQIDMKVKNWAASFPLLEKVISVEREIRKMEKLIDEI